MFVKITHDYWKDKDKDFVLELLKKKHVLTVHGSGFSKEYGKGHFRLVFLPFAANSPKEIAVPEGASFLCL